MKPFLPVLAFFAFSLHAADKHAQKPIVDPPREELKRLGGFEPASRDPADFNIHVEMQVVAMPDAVVVPLIEKMKDPQQIEKVYSTIQEMIAKKTATLVGWPMLITRSGQRAIVENVIAIRYPTEFSLPRMEVAAPGQAPNPAVPPGNAAKPDEPGKPAPKDAAGPLLGRIELNGSDIIPSAFESKTAGVTIEVEPTLNTSTMQIDLQILPQHCRFLGFEKTVIETTGRKTTIDQPRFEESKVSTNLTVQSGQRVLLGTFRVSEPAGRMELFLFKATAKPVK